MEEQANPLRLLHPWQVALILGLSERTLERYRARKTGPAFMRVEGCIRYSEPALLEYLRRVTVRTDQSDEPMSESEWRTELKTLLQELHAVLTPGGD